VLVRVLREQVDVERAAIASNEGAGMRMSALEQAAVDAKRLGDLGAFEVTESGDIALGRSMQGIRKWVGQFPKTEQAGLLNADAHISAEGVRRLRNAMLFKAYGDSPTLGRLIEAVDPGSRNVAAALMRVATRLGELRDAIKAGARHDLDPSKDVQDAVEHLARIRESGQSVDEALRQGGLFGEAVSPEAAAILRFFDANMRSSRAMADFLGRYLDGVEAAGNPKQASFLSGGVPTRLALLERSAAEYLPSAAEQVELALPAQQRATMKVGIVQAVQDQELRLDGTLQGDLVGMRADALAADRPENQRLNDERAAQVSQDEVDALPTNDQAELAAAEKALAEEELALADTVADLEQAGVIERGEPKPAFSRKAFRGSGRADRGSAYANPDSPPILGDGLYYAFRREHAEEFGPQVEETRLELENPLLIDNDHSWRNLTRAAGWEFPNPTGLPSAKQREMVERLQRIVRERGHDGIVVNFDELTPADNNRRGQSHKTIRDVFGVPQAVRFDAPSAPRAAGPLGEIERGANLTPEQQAIEARFAEQLQGDPEKAMADYAALEATEGGKILNTDDARELSLDYRADRSQSAAVHEPASALVKAMYALKLAKKPAKGQKARVVFSAGGTGAGKTTGLKKLGKVVDEAQIVYDTNMNTLDSAVRKIEQALKAGKDVVIAYTYRDPLEALKNGMLARAARQEKKLGSGRAVPLDEHLKTHIGASQVIRQLTARYGENPKVKFAFLDNSLGQGKTRVVKSVDELPELRQEAYDDLRGQAARIVEQERAEGRISETTAGAVLQAVPPVDRRGTGNRPGDRGQPESQRDAGNRGEDSAPELSPAAREALPPDLRDEADQADLFAADADRVAELARRAAACATRAA
jgi:hypothetical protein